MKFIRKRIRKWKRRWTEYKHTREHELTPVKGYTTKNKQFCRCEDCGYSGFINKDQL